MPEDFNALRLLARKLVRTKFQKQWQFRLEIEGEPTDFDLYVKDISYGTTEIATDDDTCGAVTMTWPTAFLPVKLSMTMREDEDGRVSTFVDTWCAKAVHSDGTVGIPYGADGYVKKVRKFLVHEDGSETLAEEWEMYALTRGDITQSREAGEFLEFPVTFVQFTTATSNAEQR